MPVSSPGLSPAIGLVAIWTRPLGSLPLRIGSKHLFVPSSPALSL